MSSLANKILLALVLALLFFLAWFFSDILAYVLISAVIWFILTPVVNFLDYTSVKGKSLPRWLATILSMLLFAGLITALGMYFIPRAVDQASVLTDLDVSELRTRFAKQLNRFEDILVKYNISKNPEADIEDYIKTKVVSFFGQVGDVFGYVFSMTGNFIVGLFAVFFITFFFLKDESLVKRIIQGATPERHEQKISRVLTNAKRLLSRYFIGLMIQVSIISTLVTLGLTFLGIENALLIGLFAGIINVIPYIGPIIGTSFGLFVVFTAQLQGGVDVSMGSTLLKVLIVFLVVQTLDNIVFQPIIFSNSVNAHPLEIFLIIFIAGKVGGIVGMICAIPAYTLFRIIAKEFLTQFKIVQNLTKNI
ncbi:AI-2E family transporter [bacterium]|nr:AI-2E family transporter [bacterium]